MSYFTDVEFTFAEARPDFEAVLNRARSYLESQGDRYSDVGFVLDQLRHALKKEKGSFKGLWSDDLEGLMSYVSEGFPGVLFYVRGTGEEFSDVWLRLFREGRILMSIGPFDKELEAAFRR